MNLTGKVSNIWDLNRTRLECKVQPTNWTTIQLGNLNRTRLECKDTDTEAVNGSSATI